MSYVVKDKISFLSESSKILASSLDYNVTLASIAKLLVTSIADFCLIDIVENQRMMRLAARVSDPKKQDLVNKMFDFPPDPRNPLAIYDTAKAGNPILIPEATKRWLRSVSKIKEERELVQKLGLHSFIFAPLNSRGKVIGVITLALSEPGRNYTKDDAALIDELSGRAGIAIDNARLFSEAQEALRTRDEFLSIASHELKTPLTSILLNLQLMLHRIQHAADKQVNMNELVKMIEVSRQQSIRMSGLISDLLNISVISSGRLQIEKENVDLKNITTDVIARFQIQAKRAKVEIKLDAKRVEGKWDKVRIEQVITNLLSNAIKYGNKKPINMKLSKSKKLAILTIEDRGIGISKEEQPLIFDRFKRTNAAREFKGLGIGLYIARQIVEAHKGTLTVESNGKSGSKFIMKLPL